MGDLVLKLSLPAAPSLNNSTRNVRGVGRVKSTRYKRWLKDADAHYMFQGLGHERIDVPFSVRMTFPHGLGGDVDGRAKLILDWMVSRNLTVDDKHCRRLLLQFGSSSGLVEIEVEPYVEGTYGEPRKRSSQGPDGRPVRNPARGHPSPPEG